MPEGTASRPLEPDQESLLTGDDTTLLRRLSRNLSVQSSAVSSVFRRALTNLRRTDTDETEHQDGERERDVEAGRAPAAASTSGQQTGSEMTPSATSASAETHSRSSVLASGGTSAAEAAATDAPAASPAAAAAFRSADAEIVEAAAVAATTPPSSTTHSIFGRLLRTTSGHLTGKGSGNQQPVCLICLENLGPDDFESGEAMQLECQCRGELAMRHRVCAEKWSRVKGDRVCDVCKTTIMNLPEITPRAPGSAQSGNETPLFDEADAREHPHGLHGPYLNDQIPGSADVIFDCIRVTWVAMIICILFFEMNLAMALWTGLIVGLAYTGFARAMYRTQLAAIQREMARDRERAAHGNADSPAPPMVVVV